MINIIKFALRNVLRNKKRSLLTASSIFTASIIVTFGIGFFNGIFDSILRNYINYSTGNFKVTTADFAKYERFLPMYDYISNSGEIVSGILKIHGVSSVEQRVRFGIILGKGDKSETAMGIGTDLRSKKFDLSKKLLNGKLEDEGLYVCEGFASKINIKTGDELLLVTSTTQRGLNGIKMKVKGIVRFGISMIDKRSFFIDLRNSRRLLKMQDGITEITVFTDKKADLPGICGKINSILPSGLIIRDPGQQTGGLYNVMQSALYVMYIMLMLILLLASFVIVNTMIMAVYERMKEIGTLKALGMIDDEIFMNFALEGVIIGGIGGIAGGLSGYLLVLYTSIKGLNFSSWLKNRETPIDMIVYPSADLQVLVIAVCMAVLISAISAAIPAWYARKLPPVEALRHI